MPKVVSIDLDQLKGLMRLKPSLEDTAAFFSCSPDTIERYIKKQAQVTFAEFRDQNMVHTRFALIRTALQKAQKGDNCMLIFCLKNLCGWKDRHEVTNEGGDKPVSISLSYDPNTKGSKDGEDQQ